MIRPDFPVRSPHRNRRQSSIPRENPAAARLSLCARRCGNRDTARRATDGLSIQKTQYPSARPKKEPGVRKLRVRRRTERTRERYREQRRSFASLTACWKSCSFQAPQPEETAMRRKAQRSRCQLRRGFVAGGSESMVACAIRARASGQGRRGSLWSSGVSLRPAEGFRNGAWCYGGGVGDQS